MVPVEVPIYKYFPEPYNPELVDPPGHDGERHEGGQQELADASASVVADICAC